MRPSHQIERAARLRIAIEQHLKTAIEQEALDDIGAHAPTNAIGCLDDLDLEALLAQQHSAVESRQSRTDHDHVSHAERVPCLAP
jgi:hypothetical protein